MEEKRRHKRLDLDVKIELERLDEGDVTTLKYVHVDVTDISHAGIGFKSTAKLELETFYNTTIQIWTKENLDAVVQIVRREESVDGVFKYGGRLIGMTDTDALKIDIYQIFGEN